LAVANQSSSSVSVLLGNGHGSFQAALNFDVGFSPASVAVGDFNGDGVPDLAGANQNSFSVSVLLGKGDGSFQVARNFDVGTFPVSVGGGGFHGERKAHLAGATFFVLSVLLRRGGGGGGEVGRGVELGCWACSRFCGGGRLQPRW